MNSDSNKQLCFRQASLSTSFPCPPTSMNVFLMNFLDIVFQDE